MAVSVLLAERPKDGVAQAEPGGGNDAEPPALAGLKVRDLTDEEKRAAKTDSGVMITDVEDGSAAEDAGLQPGDIIEQVGGKSVASAVGLVKTLKDLKGSRKHAALLVLNNGTPRFVALSLSE
jgi:serine protease Do